MIEVTEDEFALLLEYAAQAKGSKVAESMARELREEKDSTSKAAVLKVIGRELEVIS